MHVVHGGKHLM